MDLRRYLGTGAATGQELGAYYILGDMGKGRYLGVGEDHVIAESPQFTWKASPVGPVIYEGPLKVEVKITSADTCSVVVRTGDAVYRDDKARVFPKPETLEIYTDLFTGISLELWRDGRYSNVKIWKKIAGIWVTVLHVWTHPLHQLAADEASQPALESVASA
jgi:hypothetical protein